MKNLKLKLLSILIAISMIFGVTLDTTEAAWKFNPFTGKQDYYEPVGAGTIGGLGDVTLTSIAGGAILFRNTGNTAWINLPKGTAGQRLEISSGLPSWQTVTSTFVGLTDTPANFTGSNSYMVRVNAGATALVFGAEGAIDHDGLTNWDTNKHVDHTGITFGVSGLISGGGTLAANRTFTLTEATIETAIDTLANLTSIQGQTVTFSGSLNVEGNSNINQDVTSDADVVFNDLTISTPSNIYALNHNSFSNGAGNQHIDWTSATVGFLTTGSVTANGVKVPDSQPGNFGTNSEFTGSWNVNTGGDDLMTWRITQHADNSAAMWYSEKGILPSGFTTHDSYLSPTFIIVNSETPDLYDYAGVLIGERAQADVTIAHYFDFYAFIDSADGSTNPANIEIAAIFRFGASGSAVPGSATTPGDVLFEGNIEVNGQAYFDGDTNQYEDVFITWADALDKMVIAQTAIAGTEDQPLILIDDDRTGVTANEIGEASLVIDSAGNYGLYVKDGTTRFEQTVEIGWYLELADDYGVEFGSIPDAIVYNCTNAGNDTFLMFSVFFQGANETSMLFFNTELIEPTDMAEHDNYVNPTMVFAAQAGADSKDYAGVVIGERAQASVLVAHYFDFFVMTGSVDGSADGSNAEIGATFRFGDSGTTVPTYATGPGDVIFEDDIEVIGASHFVGNTTQYEDVFITWADALDKMVIAQSDTTGTDAQPLIFINDDRTGTYANTKEEATIRIDAEGEIALYIEDGGYYQTDMNFNIAPDSDGDITIGRGKIGDMWSDQYTLAHVDKWAYGTYMITQWANGMVAINTGTGTTGYIRQNNANVASWSASGFTAIIDFIANEDVFITWADAADHAVITQTDTTGTDAQPLIFINDDRTGSYADSKEEATIRIDAEGTHAMYVEDGIVHISATSGLELGGHAWMYDTKEMRFGTGGNGNFSMHWETSTSGDDLMIFKFPIPAATDSTALFIYSAAPNPVGLTSHENYVSPTLVIANSGGADLNDYAGVVIGERTQADVEVAHYFDFFVMTGAIDAAADPTTTEIPAIFRFGASGSAVPGNATTPGDVLFEGAIEVNGNVYMDGTGQFTAGTSINEFSIDGTLAGNSDDAIPTEKAIVTYVAAQITAEDLDFAGDGGTGAVDLNSQTFTLTGTDPIDTAAANQVITISHKTTDGYKHIPSTGAAAQILQYSAAGTAKWITFSSDITIADNGAVTVVSASDTVAGKIEIATIAEVNTGTSTVLAVSPDALEGSNYGIKTVILKVVAFDVAIPAAGDGKAYVTIPAELDGFNLVSCGAHVYTASDTGAVSVQIHNLTQTDDMLTTNITIDQDELDSKDAGTPPVIDGTTDDVVTGDALRMDIDGAGANGTGLEIRMGFRKVV